MAACANVVYCLTAIQRRIITLLADFIFWSLRWKQYFSVLAVHCVLRSEMFRFLINITVLTKLCTICARAAVINVAGHPGDV